MCGKSCFTGWRRVQRDSSHKVKLWFSTVGNNPGAWVICLTPQHTHFLTVGNLGISSVWCFAFPCFTCALLFFISCSPTGPSSILFCIVTGTVVFHLFHTEILFLHIYLAIWKDTSSRKWIS